MEWDIALFRLINDFFGSGAVLPHIAIFLATYLAWLTIIFFVCIAYFREREISLGLYIEALFSAFFARFAVGALLKELIARPRPYLSFPGVHALIVESGYSLPSGHATFFFALAIYLFNFDRRWGTVFLILATLISIGRIAVGVHYPTDILAGAVLGTAIGLGSAFARRTLFK